MKKTLLLLLIIPLVSFGQKVKYELLDSSLNVVKVKNIHKLSSKERKKIYHYAEYSYNSDEALIGIKTYYAKGKYPTYDEIFWNEITNKKGKISFSNIEKRKGIIRTKTVLGPVKIDLNNVFNRSDSLRTYYKSSEKFYPNGQQMSKMKFADGQLIDGEYNAYNNRGEKIVTTTFRDGKLVREDADDYYLIYDPFHEDGNNYTTTQYDKYTDKKKNKWYFYNGVENIKKRERFSSSGRNIYTSDNLDESSLKEYFKNNDTPILEGVYTVKSTTNNRNYKIALLETVDDKFYGYQLSGFQKNFENWKTGEVRTTFEKTSVDGFYNVTWYNDYKKQELSEIVEMKNGIITSFGNYNMIKLYPEVGSRNTKETKKTGEWAGNGSGIIISKSGHIITNHHVIEDADYIEVEFILDNQLQKFNAEIVQVDKTNDLALIKIFDINFDGVNEPPYNFKLRGSDVGTKVYAYGYPMALTIMGKEIKVTDGMISSKTGFDGNITTYQITAPIQGGNSGGPLFDDQANLIGINSSGIRKDIADNVAYSIKTSYVSNLLDILPKSIDLPSSNKLKSLPLTKQIKEISKYVVLIKVK
ncbi:trypsin-like peptidase domain-containing protein [Saprospiraceae bacterium]|nr:trypsin-like peptidase domain-containing protein [Saprospiraceae bacterium]